MGEGPWKSGAHLSLSLHPPNLSIPRAWQRPATGPLVDTGMEAVLISPLFVSDAIPSFFFLYFGNCRRSLRENGRMMG